jgi:hypothetical protein
MREQRLIDARDQLLGIARQEFESNKDVVGLFVAGSLAAGSHDAYSDIDLRVVVKSEKQQWFIEHRREIPRAWPGFLFNEWRPGTRHCVSHFRFFVKIDIFYFGESDLQPSAWHTLPIAILLDRYGAIEQMVRASEHLKFEITHEDLDFSISKGLAAAHEVFRRTRRGELVFAQTLLDELRFHIIQADDWLFDRTPRTQLFSKFDQRGSPDVVQCLRRSFCGCDIAGLDAALASLCRLYRRQIKQLHTKFELVRPLESDLIAIDLILGEFVAPQ